MTCVCVRSGRVFFIILALVVQGGVFVVVGQFVSQLRIHVNPRLDYVYIGDWVALLYAKLQFDGFVISRICNFTIEFLAIYIICDDVNLLFRFFC